MDINTQKKLLRTVKRNYEEIADDFSVTRMKRVWPEIEKIVQEIEPGAKVLDVGCGNGRLISAFGDKQIEYLGIDNCDRLLHLAQKQYPDHRFRIGNILEFGKVPEINFDRIFCVAVLHHIPSQNLRVEALRQLKNKISENGKIVISVWNFWEKKKQRNLIFRYLLLKFIGKNSMDFGDILFDWRGTREHVVTKRYYHAFTMGELKRIVRRSGLHIERSFKDKYNYYLILKK